MSSFTVNEKYQILLCSRHPEMEDFDHVSTSEEFEDLATAHTIFQADNPIQELAKTIANDTAQVARYIQVFGDTPYVWLEGPGISLIRQLRPESTPDNDDDWRREIAMEAGMAFGCDGYNDAMGY